MMTAQKQMDPVNPVHNTDTTAAGSRLDRIYEQDLRSFVADVVREMTSGTRKTVPWGEYCRKWFDTYKKPRLRPNTVFTQEVMISKWVIPAFDDRPINIITSEDVQKFLNSMADYSKAYVRDIKNLMSQAFSSAVEDEIISKNPMKSIKVFNPATREVERKVLSRGEQLDIIAHIDDLKEPHDRAFMAFLMFSSMRPSEIYGLQWGDINKSAMTLEIKRGLTFAHGFGIIGDTKTTLSKRIVPICNELAHYLFAEGMHTDDVWVFTRMRQYATEMHHTQASATRMWKRIKACIDVHGMTPYSGRHTFATNMSRSGVPIKAAMAVMGHKDERMLLRRYIHSDSSDITEAVNAVTQFIKR